MVKFLSIGLISLALLSAGCNSPDTSTQVESYHSAQESSTEATFDDGYDQAADTDIDNFDDCQDEFGTGDAEDGCNEYVKENYSGYQTFNGYECTEDCSGHEAGYNWAEENGIEDEYDCDGNSGSFNEGCVSYVEENY